MPRGENNQEVTVDLQYPLEGLDETRAFSRQRTGTTASAQNARSFDPKTGRARGGQRPGLSRYFTATAVGAYPIQDINHLVTNDIVAAASASVGQLLYAKASGAGFGLAAATGVSYYVNAGAASFEFICSCWDDDGNIYVAERNQTSGAVRLSCIASASPGTVTWLNTTILTIPTGANRGIAGMVVIGSELYIAVLHTVAPVARIYKLTKSNGVAAAGTVAGLWMSNTSTGLTNLRFSTSSTNCLGKIGTMMGIDSVGTAALQAFFIINTVTAALAVTTAYTGTAAMARSKVVSDGVAFFYVLASVTTAQVKKIGLGGVIEWSSAGAATATGLAYDFSAAALYAATGTTPCVKKLSLTAGATVSSGDPGSVTSWTEIDTDNAGFITLWRAGAAASTDAMGTNSTYSTIWGPTNFANATTSNYGASVNKGKVLQVAATSSRQIRGLVVSNGECRRFDSSGATAIANGQSFKPNAPVVFSSQNGLNMFYVDGATYKYYKSTTNAIAAWTPTAGTMPVDAHTARARLVCTWRGRIVLAGLPFDPGNWFMSKQYDPFNWDYGPSVPTVADAVSGDVAEAGFIGDFVNALVAYTDDTMIFGCDHTIWQLTGDPLEGGRFDLVSDSIGMAWGRAFARDPFGQIYFFGSRCGVFKITPGALPVRVSQQIERQIESVDLSANIVRMEWDLQAQGLHVWITPTNPLSTAMHFFMEDRTNAWWPVVYANKNHNPLATHVSDGDGPNDRTIMIGSQNGYVRVLSNDADTDDGTTIESYVVLGPLTTRQMDDILLKDLQVTLGESAGDVTYEIYVGKSAEAALMSDAVVTGKWKAGRNHVSPIQRNGIAIYIKISATEPWAVERIAARFAPQGSVRRRM